MLGVWKLWVGRNSLEVMTHYHPKPVRVLLSIESASAVQKVSPYMSMQNVNFVFTHTK